MPGRMTYGRTPEDLDRLRKLKEYKKLARLCCKLTKRGYSNAEIAMYLILSGYYEVG